ncbi:hypothetical protein DM860_003377 [Cuscuta australis]|uniref:40S ribosomal protein S14 n=1 Tax=Cuscuta australis TaxID=267555 RepID=A0A328DJ10_9ASTE|nr:hypothetical protein DM860_003377 [Cuscuta australis]
MLAAQEAAHRDESSSPSAASLAAQDVARQCKELGVTALHIKFQTTTGVGNTRNAPGLGAQSALRALARSGLKIGRIVMLHHCFILSGWDLPGNGFI